MKRSLQLKRILLGAAVLLCLLAGPLMGQTAEQEQQEQELSERFISISVQETTTLISPEPIKQVEVANPGIVEVNAISPVKLLISGKQYGRTTMTLETADGEKITYVVSVGLDLSALQATIEKVSPYSRVKVSSIMDTVILSGSVPDVQTSGQILGIAGIYSNKVMNHMEIAGVQQIQLRVTIAEVSRTATRALGINFQAAGGTAFIQSMVGGIQPMGIGWPGGTAVDGSMPFFTADQVIPPSITMLGGLTRANLQAFIIAMQDNNLLHILAEPTLITLNGHEASFLAGGEFPVPVAQEGGVVTVEFREYGTRLRFTPTVLAGQLMRLKIASEVSEPDASNAVVIGGLPVPGKLMRSANTTIELGSGQTFAIAGLLSERTSAIVSRVPGLGNLPILGVLFRSVRYQKNETELIIIVTPELIEPLNPAQVGPIPGENLRHPNNFRLFGLGQIENTSQVPAERLRRGKELFNEPSRLKGPWGPTDKEEGS